MAKDWIYANFAKVASANGGPVNYLNSIARNNFKAGFNSGHLRGAAELLLFEGACYGCYRAGRYFFENRKSKNKEVQMIEPIKLFEIIKNDCYNERGENDESKKQNRNNPVYRKSKDTSSVCEEGIKDKDGI